MEGDNGSGSPQRSAASARWIPSSDQFAILEALYKDGLHTPTAEQIREITEKLNEYGRIEEKNVFYWFQNHKARERQREKQEDFAFLAGLGPNPRPDVAGRPLYLQAPQMGGRAPGFYQHPHPYHPPAPVRGTQLTEMPPPPPPPPPSLRENTTAPVNRMQMSEMPPPPPWPRGNAPAAVNRRNVPQMPPAPWMRLFNRRRPPMTNSTVPAYLQGTPYDPNFVRYQELLSRAAIPEPAPVRKTLDLFPQYPTGVLKEKFAGSSTATGSVEDPGGNSREGEEGADGEEKMSLYDFLSTSHKPN